MLVETIGLSGCGLFGDIVGSPSPSRPAQLQTVEGDHNKLESSPKQAIPHNQASLHFGADLQNKLSNLKPFVGKASTILGFCPIPSQPGQDTLPALSVSDTGEILAWNKSFNQSFLVQKVPHPISAFACGARTGVVAIGYERRLEVYSLGTESPAYVLDKVESRASSLSLDPSEEALLIGGIDGRVYRWRFVDAQKKLSIKEKNRILERYFGHASPISSVAYHPFGRMFFSADLTGGLSGWLASDKDLFQGKYDENLFSGRFLTEKPVKGNAGRADVVGITQMLISTDGQNLICLLQDGRVEWWLVRGFKKVAEIQAHRGLIYAGALSGDGKTLVTAGRDGTAKLFTLVVEGPDDSKFSIRQDKEMPESGVSSISFLPDNRVLAGISGGKVMTIQFPS